MARSHSNMMAPCGARYANIARHEAARCGWAHGAPYCAHCASRAIWRAISPVHVRGRQLHVARLLRQNGAMLAPLPCNQRMLGAACRHHCAIRAPLWRLVLLSPASLPLPCATIAILLREHRAIVTAPVARTTLWRHLRAIHAQTLRHSLPGLVCEFQLVMTSRHDRGIMVPISRDPLCCRQIANCMSPSLRLLRAIIAPYAAIGQ